MSENRSDAIRGIHWKLLLRFVIFVLLFPVLLFVVAGRLDWVMGWIYAGMIIVFTIASRTAVMLRNPELIRERAQFTKAEAVKSWDRKLVPFVALIGPLAICVVAGLDVRFEWSPQISPIYQIIAMILVAFGYVLATWAMVTNKFFSGVVRIQKDRGHTVVTDGPYRYVRHPGYSGGIICHLATAPALGSIWALIPAALTVCLLILRTALEDRTLRDELDGYGDYAQRVHYRLLPGVW